MDLIASQLIAPHASTKLNQTEGPIHKPHGKSDSAWHRNKVILTAHDSAFPERMSKRAPWPVTGGAVQVMKGLALFSSGEHPVNDFTSTGIAAQWPKLYLCVYTQAKDEVVIYAASGVQQKG